jgi:hypothetical protein
MRLLGCKPRAMQEKKENRAFVRKPSVSMSCCHRAAKVGDDEVGLERHVFLHLDVAHDEALIKWAN